MREEKRKIWPLEGAINARNFHCMDEARNCQTDQSGNAYVIGLSVRHYQAFGYPALIRLIDKQ